jgi:hypothetical protein
MKKRMAVCVQVFLILLTFSSYASAVDWRFPVGLSYAGNFHKVVDFHEDYWEARGFDVDTSWQVPVGITFQPYVEFDFGLGIGAGFGPITYILTETDYYYYDDDDYYHHGDTETDFWNIPVNLNLRYSFIPKGGISPYIRGGISYNIADGDFVDKSKPGPFGAVGVEFSRKNAVGFGFEVGYDASEITFEADRYTYSYYDDIYAYRYKKDIKPIGFFASIFAIF